MKVNVIKGIKIKPRSWEPVGIPVRSSPYSNLKYPPIIDGEEKKFGDGSIKLNSAQLMDKILQALEEQKPFSVISVGATEAFVMAQYAIYSEEEFMSHREAYNANLGEKSGFFHRGVRFPNLQTRDDAVEAARKADIIGYNTIVREARELTEKVFLTYEINPRFIFEANIRRVWMFSQPDKFENMLRGRKILLVGSLAPKARDTLNLKLKSRLNFEIVGAIPIYDYEEIPQVKEEIKNYDFDLCILAAGTNALILAPYIAEKCGKVAFDIGWSMQSLITGEVVHDTWIDEVIGLEKLLQM